MSDQLPAPPCFLPQVCADRIGQMERQLAEVHRAVVGDPQLGHRGLVARMEAVEKSDAAQDRKFISWSGVVLGALFVLQFLKEKLFG